LSEVRILLAFDNYEGAAEALGGIIEYEKRAMDQGKEKSSRNPIRKDLFYMFVCGCLFAAGILAWKHFHHEDANPGDLEAREKAERLTDH